MPERRTIRNAWSSLKRRWRGDEPSPRRRKLARWLRAGGTVLLLAYALVVAYPGFLFAHHHEHGAFSVWSDRPIPPAIDRVLDDAARRLARSELDDPRATHRVYLCASPLLRRFLTPTTSNAFGSTRMLRGNSFLNRSDIEANRITTGAARWNVRPLSAVIAHERVHALMTDRYGAIGCLRMPTWVKEGYCEFIAGDPSYVRDLGRERLRRGESDDAPAFRYFEYGLMVRYLIEVEGLGIDAIAARSFDEDELRRKVRANLDRL